MKPLRSAGGPPILVVIQDGPTRAAVLEVLAPLACTLLAENTAEAEALLRQDSYALLVIEDELPVETGLMFLARINAQYPWLRRILVCDQPDSALLLFLINEANVFRCATKPIDPGSFRAMATGALADYERLRQLADSAAEGERRRDRTALATLHHWLVSLPRFFLISLLAMGWVFGLGVTVLIALYLLKTLLGIDLIEGLHLIDLFR
jgi:DNA-binding NtrC family response regulator